MPRRTLAAPSSGLVLVRVVSGLVLARQGWRWVREGTLDGQDVRSAVGAALEDLAAPVAWWGREVLLANPDATALFWRWAALALGLALVLGLLVRPAGTLAAWFLAHGVVFGPAQDVRLHLLLGACALACALSDAGDRLGLDAALSRQLPDWLTWRRGRRDSPFA